MSEFTPPEGIPTVDTRGADQLFAELTDDFLRRHRAGERPSMDEYTAKRPDLANRILELFPVMLAMEPVGAAPDATERVGSTIGRYKLLQLIGEGGFGVVYMAEQLTPVRRKVALKVIKPGVDTKQVTARFEAERQALALMDHENIAKVLDAGATDGGRPFFVMELVHGVPITQYCDQNELAPRQRLDLFGQVCRAVQHAHTKGIIHRDIKPTNVLVTLHEGAGVPKVIDFGVAKATGQQLTEKTLFTNFAQMVGTPLYMSPEQAEMTGVDVDARSDIYSLGVLLYELLTGTTPLDKDRLKGSAFDEIRRIIREEEPPRPSTRLSTLGEQLRTISGRRKSNPAQLGRLVRGELDWIVMRALEKERSRRYDTANALARDIERYLSDEAVEACPPSAGYRFRKFARRNRRALVTVAIVAAALLAGTVVSTWEAIRANRAALAERAMREQATQSEARAVENATVARRQGSRANKYFLNARAVFDGMAGRLNDPALLRLPEVATLRKQLLMDLLGCYEKIVRDDVADPAAVQDKASALRMVGDIEHKLGDRVLAEKAYRDAIAQREAYVAQNPDAWDSYPVLATCYTNLGELMAEERRIDEAEATFRHSLVLWIWLASNHTYHSTGASACVTSLRATHKTLFNLLEDRGQHDAARAILGQLLAPFEQSAVSSPEEIEPQLRLADACYWGSDLLKDTGRAEEGDKLRDRALNLYGKLPAATPPSERAKFAFRYFCKAILLNERKRPAEAADACRKSIELNGKASMPYFALAKLLVDQNKLDEAIAVYTSASTANPPSAMHYNNFAWLLATHVDPNFRNPAGAVAEAKKAIELDPTNPIFPNTLGVAYYRAGDFKAAIAALEKSIEVRQGGNSYDFFFLAMSQWQLGDRLAARQWYDKAVEWMQNNSPNDFKLLSFRDEASKLLGMPSTRPAVPASRASTTQAKRVLTK